MADYEVDRAQLVSAGQKFTALKTSTDTAGTTLDGLGLTQSDFGNLQWLGLNAGIWDAYRDHTKACHDSLEQMGNAIASFGEGLHYTQLAYQGMEDAADEVARKLIEEIVSGDPA